MPTPHRQRAALRRALRFRARPVALAFRAGLGLMLARFAATVGYVIATGALPAMLPGTPADTAPLPAALALFAAGTLAMAAALYVLLGLARLLRPAQPAEQP